MNKFLFILLFSLFCATPAKAEFIVSSAIIEFKKDGPVQQDIELVSRSKQNDYIASEISEIVNPGLPNEKRILIEDPSRGKLLVSPDKTILTGESRKLVRFILLQNFDQQEHIYRVALKPVINDLDNNSKIGLKVLIGYEILVIIRPAEIRPSYQAQRRGKIFSVLNNGNSNVIFENGKQCVNQDCRLAPVIRVYPGQRADIELPLDTTVSYSIWNGIDTIEKQF